MQNVYVITHAQSEHHIQGRVGGWYDTSLTARGRDQAKAVAARLRGLIPTNRDLDLISSDLKRAAETANVIGTALGKPVALDRGFREISYGEAEGKPQEWLDERIVPAPASNRLDHRIVAGAESKREFMGRIYASMSKLSDTSDTIIVTHGFALTFVIANWIGMRMTDAGYVNFAATPGGITHLQRGGFFDNKAINYLNDTSHLANIEC
ncbi:MAG: histidine phosphatase family protein [Hyphomonadaceae bacterium]|nr:histidine phosphatase family protein [Hyphomonadaceae bacterium]